MKKSVISLISYDSHMLPDSIKSYYNYVDEIILGLDKDRITWSGNKFTFDEKELWSQLQKIDGDNKISIIEENFHNSDVALDNDNQERNFLRSQCSYDWLLSFDADETLINAKDFFTRFAPLAERYVGKIDLSFFWILPYKEFEEYYLVIANDDNSLFTGDTQGFATHKDSTYTYCRWTNTPRCIISPLVILHWSFCRKEEEVEQKIHNFGHSDKTPTDPFFDSWKQVTMENYTQLKNFKTSGFGSTQWNKLIQIPKGELLDISKATANRVY